MFRSHTATARTTRRRPLFRPDLDVLDERITPDVSFTPSTGLMTTERGGYALVRVSLTTRPTAGVAVFLSSDNMAEGVVSTPRLVFTPANFHVPQAFYIIGLNDGVRDGDQVYHVVVSIYSVDPKYSGLAVPDLNVTNLDNGAIAGFVVTPTSGLVTTSAGGSDTFTVALTGQPRAPVYVPVRSLDPSQGRALPATLVFTSANWSQPQTVRVFGMHSPFANGDVSYTVALLPAFSADPNYNYRDAPDVSVINQNESIAVWDGLYTGIYAGNIVLGGRVYSINGAVRLSVTNGTITVQKPAAGTGTIAANNTLSFSTTLPGGYKTTFTGVLLGADAARRGGGSWAFYVTTANGVVYGRGGWNVLVS